MKGKVQDRLRTFIMDQLANEPATVPDIAARGGFNAETTRQAVRRLESEGLVSPDPASKGSFRNVKWTAQLDPNAKNSVIPYITAVGRTVKMINLLKNAKESIYSAPDYFVNLPRHIVRIFDLADKAHSGSNVNVQLKLLRSEMEKDLENARQLISLYEQVLKDPRNWNPDTLKRYINDEVYDKELVETAYQFYFASE